MEGHLKLKNLWGSLNDQWTQLDIRDIIIDFIAIWSKKAEIKALRLSDKLEGRERNIFKKRDKKLEEA